MSMVSRVEEGQQRVKANLTEFSLPERAVSRATSHGTEEVGIDFDDLLHGLRSYKQLRKELRWEEKKEN
jgi:hypothetical protein